MATKSDNSKQFSLKPIEVHMLQTMQDSYFAGISNFLSFIALERLAYNVTTHTKFDVKGDTLTVTEGDTPTSGAPPKAETPASSGNSSVSTGSDTASAIGGK